jgi:hypothetical protein
MIYDIMGAVLLAAFIACVAIWLSPDEYAMKD